MDKFFALFDPHAADPESALEKMVTVARDMVAARSLEDTFGPRNNTPLPFVVSNAAGFNKNGLFPPQFLYAMGFDRAVVGTVTHESWKGNPRPRMGALPASHSVINWMGVPGLGSQRVADILSSYTAALPLTVSIASTPHKVGDEALADLQRTVEHTKKYTDRFELNVSCPNIKDTNQRELHSTLRLLQGIIGTRELYLKVSPDLRTDDIDNLLDVVQDFHISGVVGGNTTRHLPRDIATRWAQGGASGAALTKLANTTQRHYVQEITRRKLALRYISCGGIHSVREVKKRVYHGASEIQIFTALLFHGSTLLKKIRSTRYHTI